MRIAFGTPAISRTPSPSPSYSNKTNDIIKNAFSNTSDVTQTEKTNASEPILDDNGEIFVRKVLTQDQKDYLKEKYDIKGMKYASDEHYSFVKELFDMGAISRSEWQDCFSYTERIVCRIEDIDHIDDIKSIHYDEDGKEIGYGGSSKYESGTSLYDFYNSDNMFKTYNTGFDGYMDMYYYLIKNSSSTQALASAEEMRNYANGCRQMADVINSIFE